MIETAEKEEKEIDDASSLSEEERSLSSGIYNILGTLVKGELLQMLHTSGFSGFEAWRKTSKRYSPTTTMKGMQLMMAAINPGKAKGLEEVAIHIDRWEAKVLALSRDFNELLKEKMRAAILISMLPPDLQHALIQQADKIEDYKSTRDRVATIVEAKLTLKNPDAMECDAVHRSTGTRKLGKTTARLAMWTVQQSALHPLQPRGKETKESGMDSAPTGRQTSGRSRRISADSKSAAWTEKRCTGQGCIFPTCSRH